ncbi:MAG: DNA-protecting protein DprA [Coriobacteriia bacterium]|nr:DNA-protecting protein DprA [Coriobacteriia bacterium]MCL2537359.1 DNA-protecting protein DprA [Coriobacteriia bacterium]
MFSTLYPHQNLEPSPPVSTAKNCAYPDGLQSFEIDSDDASYPQIVGERMQSVPTLYGIGREDSLRPGIAIIGARNATPYGKRIARLVGSWAADLDMVVYSGGARGCDQAAHQGALEAGGITVAVMGCGADISYPTRAGKLLSQIAEQGAVISSYPWGAPPMKYRFRERNQLIAALSDLVVVVEARLPSGTLSTVHHALEMGVAVAAVPGSILCLESAAPNRLISEGAAPICCREDLAIACNFSSNRLEVPAIFQQSRFDFASEKGSAPDALLREIASMPLLPDELALSLDRSVAEVLETLGSYEVQGLVQRHPDGRYGLPESQAERSRARC